MNKNKLGYLGLLGFLGLLGLTGNIGFFGFFGFFAYFSFFQGRGSDERIDQNINQACRNAFIYYTIIASFILAYVGMAKTYELMPVFVVALFQGLIVFGISFSYYNNKGE